MMIKTKKFMRIKYFLLALLVSAPLVTGVTLKMTAGQDAAVILPASLWEIVNNAEIDGNQFGPDPGTTQAPNPDCWIVDENGAQLSGIIVNNNKDGATVRFKNLIDVSNSVQNNPLLTFQPIPEKKGEPVIKNMRIRLTDALDSENYIEIRATHDSTDSHKRESMSFFQVTYPGIPGGAPRAFNNDNGSGIFVDEEGWGNGTRIKKSFAGYAFEPDYGTYGTHVYYGNDPARRISPMAISYNAAEKRIYALSGNSFSSNWWELILDLNDPNHVGAGNEWGGFKGDLVSISVTAGNFPANSSYMITDVAGINMGGTAIVDTGSPYLKAETTKLAGIPLAQVDREYNIFEITAEDAIDGNLNSLVETALYKPNGASVDLTGETAFIPEAPGDYRLEYSVDDYSGNRATVSVEINAVMRVPEIELVLNGTIPEAATIGDRINIPAYTVEGGSGGLAAGVSVYRLPGGKQYQITSKGYFTPDVSGIYCVDYSVTDYIGNKETRLNYINVTRGSKPVVFFIDEDRFPKKLIGDHEVMLPQIEAYDYITDHAMPRNANVKIEISYDGGATFGTSGVTGYIIRPDSAKTSAQIRYTAYCGSAPSDANGGNYISKTYQSEIINPEHIWDYFIKDNIAEYVHGHNGVVDTTHSQDVLEFRTASENDASLEFVNRLSANDFSLRFTIPKERNNFAAVRITMTDYINPVESLEFDINKSSGSSKSDVHFNGMKYSTSGSFSAPDGVVFELKYTNNSLLMRDYNDGTIFNAGTARLADGSMFDGFSSGRVYLKIELIGVSGASAIRLMRICNQPIYPNYDLSGQLRPFSDRTSPMVERDFEPETTTEINKSFELPAVFAFDVIDPYVRTHITVTAPDGSKVIDNVSADMRRSFTPASYGTYIVSYRAVDASGRTGSMDYIIEVINKTRPTITINGTLPAEIQRGKSAKIPDAQVSGGDNIKLYIFVVEPGHIMKELSAEDRKKYVFAKHGEYSIIYYAVTAANYSSTKTVTVFVK